MRKILNEIRALSGDCAIRVKSLADYSADWLLSKQVTTSEGTFTRYKGFVSNFLGHVGKQPVGATIEAVTPQDVKSFRDNAVSSRLRSSQDTPRTLPASLTDSRETRIGLSAAARKAAETFAKMPGSKVIKHAQAHGNVTRSASVLHGWDDKGNPVPFSLNVLNIGSCGIEICES